MPDLRFQSHTLDRFPRANEARQILRAALDAADPAGVVGRAVRREGDLLRVGDTGYDLRQFRHVYVVGTGKAVLRMASQLAETLADRLTGGVLVPKHLPTDLQPALPDSVRVIQGQHPVPGPGSVAGAQAIYSLLAGCGESDLIIALISGGGSALLTLPRTGVSLENLQEMTRQLLACGAEIGEINTLRKHLDQVKGGGLAGRAYPATLVTLILSDVIGSPLSAIASGPTVPDPTTFADVQAVLIKYGLDQTLPRPILDVIHAGLQGSTPETLKPGDPALERVQNLLVGSNVHSARAAVQQAQAAGFHAQVLTTEMNGEARLVGQEMGARLRQIAWSGGPQSRPFCLVAGGETTVTLRGNGLGGRNLELALGAVAVLAGVPKVLLVTLATDGEDGPTGAAGAVVSGETLVRAQAAGLDPAYFLAQNNSHPFFQALDDLLITGPSGTNVNDLLFLFGA